MFSEPRGNPCVSVKKTLGQVGSDSCHRPDRPLSSVIVGYNMFFLSWWSSTESIWHFQRLQGSSWRIKACKNIRVICSCGHSTLYNTLQDFFQKTFYNTCQELIYQDFPGITALSPGVGGLVGSLRLRPKSPTQNLRRSDLPDGSDVVSHVQNCRQLILLKN
jgi:hypothetical protein